MAISFDRLALYRIRPSWPPPLETYCYAYRRWVEAQPYGGGRSTIPVRHFQVAFSHGQDDIRVCGGMYAPEKGNLRPGVEDPAAAFYTDVKDWVTAQWTRPSTMEFR